MSIAVIIVQTSSNTTWLSDFTECAKPRSRTNSSATGGRASGPVTPCCPASTLLKKHETSVFLQRENFERRFDLTYMTCFLCWLLTCWLQRWWLNTIFPFFRTNVFCRGESQILAIETRKRFATKIAMKFSISIICIYFSPVYFSAVKFQRQKQTKWLYASRCSEQEADVPILQLF